MSSPVSRDCVNALNKIGNGGPGIEREVRFGRFQGITFIPGVTKRQFDSILKLFIDWPTTQTTDRVISRPTGTNQSIRKITNSNGTNKYQLKQKLETFDVPSEGIRISKAKERTMNALKNAFNNIPASKNYKQTRERTTFKKGSIQIDVTHQPENTRSPFQVEIEYSDPKEVCKYIKLIKNDLQNVYFKSIVFSQYRSLTGGARFAGPLPQTLTLNAFKKKVLTKNNYAVTEKADGERYLLFIDNIGGFNLISRKTEIIRMPKIAPHPELAWTLIDGEFVNGIFYSFDGLFIKGVDIRSNHLKTRLTKLFSMLVKLRNSKIKMKSFFIENNGKIIQIPSNRNTGFKNIYQASGNIWSKKTSFPYQLDGLIFTPVNEPYMNRNTYKWKDDNTIDFYYNKNKLFLAGTKSNGTYGILPFSGIDGKGTFMSKGKEVKNLIFIDQTIPAQLRSGVIGKTIAGSPMVGEFKFDDNTFKLLRKRPDKELPNGVDASNQSWEAIVNPITEGMISIGPGAMRDFHSEIKATLISKYAKGKSVLDIGSGKGENVGKYVKANSKPVVGFDLVEEEYPHPEYMSFYRVNSPIYRVKNFINKNQKFDVININFAIHYFLANKKLFESLVMNIHDNLKSGGIVMGTVLDGRKIYNALKGKNKISTSSVNFTKKYNNSLNFNSPKFKFFGQKVDVLVKGTKYFGNRSITEFLFNFEKFLKIMEQMGFELVEMKSFKDLCDDSAWCRRYMSGNEKDYSFKNIYFVLKKK